MNNKGSINILILSVLFILLISIALILYQLNRMIDSNTLFYNQISVRNFALALEEKYIKYEGLGIFCGEFNGKNYYVSKEKQGDNYKIFIVVENQWAIFTIDLSLDDKGKVINRLENVPKGERTCW
ncbi:hypothetical protein SAMN02745227_00453 [Anaerobranca californiensis DSM 14826]|uniref:Uncharacterized protein n=1 Tax=Anaerobranca californiensis DSM 14826 TaxID=1120989 RepID=A0A1M6LC22_9FIRM|nr:hypothetical protein [Anaerobranca californiensis]SHJ68733.1 hypothetical protein SAMN02745227_00453 [Anaerobranca californiensis DSM 14826]